MAKKNTVKDRQAKPASTTKTDKGKKGQEPMNRQERRGRGKARAAQKAAKAKPAPPVHEPAGLTLAQLESLGPTATKRPASHDCFEQTLLEVVAEQAQQFESAEPVSLPAIPDPEVQIFIGGQVYTPADYETAGEPFRTAATRKVVADEICSLLGKTEGIFNACHSLGPSSPATQLAIGNIFEKEPEGDSSLRLRFAEVILTDDPGEAIEEFLEEVYDRIQELQVVASALDPESELEKSARLGLIDEATVARLKRAAAEEAVRLDLAQRLAGLSASATTLTEVDSTFATLITEAAQAAEVQRRGRATFRKTLSQRLRQRKEREGRRFSKSSEESGDEEFIRFLFSHGGNLAAVCESLPFHLREQVETLLEDEKRKGPFRRQIAAATKAANQLWAGLKSRLATAADADDPEAAVAQNAAAMRALLGNFAQTRALHERLEELDKPRKATTT